MGVNKFFTYAQWVNMTFLAFNHSFNDSQKSIGIIMILIGIYGGESGGIPVWSNPLRGRPVCHASAIAFGGFKIIKTVGTGIYRVQPIHSFASQLTAGTVILSSSLVGAPVSASQIVSSSHHGRGGGGAVQGGPAGPWPRRSCCPGSSPSPSPDPGSGAVLPVLPDFLNV